MNYAPVALFVYKRPDHLQQTLEHLKKNEGAKETSLYIFSEGPKADASVSDHEAIKAVRQIIHDISGFKEVIIQEAQSNIGCADSIVAGITHVLTKHESIIILEDDIITHPLFLKFCNCGLEQFKDDEKVMQIGTFMFPTESTLPLSFLSRKVFCWGWATWKRAWKELDRDTNAHYTKLKNHNLIYDFDLKGVYPYFKSLEAQSSGDIDAWDICWYATIFLKQGLSLYPSFPLSQNIGLDGSGTHFRSDTGTKIPPFQVDENILSSIPSAIQLDEKGETVINLAVANWSKLSSIETIKVKINNLINKLRK